MVLPVYVYGMSVLRKVSQEIPEDYEGLQELINDLFETMSASDGVGLAAPQVGKSLRIFVVDTTPMSDEKQPELKDFRKVFINPIVLEEWGDSWSFEEGCLSLPTIREDVNRPTHVRIEYFDENWTLHEEVYDGIRARVIQHEYDHLEGILFTDKINPIRKKLLAPKLKAISHGKVDSGFRIIYPGKLKKAPG